MKNPLVVVFTALFFMFSVPSVLQATEAQCLKKTIFGQKKLTFKACIDQPEKIDRSSTVLYFLHGHGGSEKGWLKSKLRTHLRNQWRKIGPNRIPSVITFSLGRKTNLADKATLNAVFNELMPFLETRLQFNPEKGSSPGCPSEDGMRSRFFSNAKSTSIEWLFYAQPSCAFIHGLPSRILKITLHEREPIAS